MGDGEAGDGGGTAEVGAVDHDGGYAKNATPEGLKYDDILRRAVQQVLLGAADHPLLSKGSPCSLFAVAAL